jgi:hypothetical protein
MEDKMTAPKSLKSLTFAVLPKLEANPVQDRRTKTIARLEEQKLLFNDPNFTRAVRTSVKGEDGVRSVVDASHDGGFSLLMVRACSLFDQDGSRLSSTRVSRQSSCFPMTSSAIFLPPPFEVIFVVIHPKWIRLSIDLASVVTVDSNRRKYADPA